MLVRYVRVLQRPKASPKSDPVGHQAGKSQRIAVQVQRWSGGRTSFSSGDHSLYAVRPSTDWMKPTRIGKGICFTQSLPPEMSTRQKTTVAGNKTKNQKTPSQNIQGKVGVDVRAHVWVTRTREMKHHMQGDESPEKQGLCQGGICAV